MRRGAVARAALALSLCVRSSACATLGPVSGDARGPRL